MKIGTLLIEMVANVARLEREMGQARRSVEGTMRRISRATRLATTAMQGFVGALSIRELARASDQYKSINAALQIATRSAQKGAIAYQQVFDIAMSTGQAISGVADTYRRFAEVSDQLGVSQTQIAASVKTVAQAMAISGGSAESARAALLQFSQGLSAGTLRGQELNSVMEQSPRLARLIADGMGLPIGALREFAAEGKITSNVILDALESQAKVIEEEYSKIPLTIGRATTNLNTAFTDMVGNVENSIGVFGLLANAINGLAQNLEAVAEIVLVLSMALVGRLVGALAAVAKKAVATGGALAVLRGAMAFLGGPLGLAFTAASALLYFADKASDAKNQVVDLNQAIADLNGDLGRMSNQQKTDLLLGLGMASKTTAGMLADVNKQIEKLENSQTTRRAVLELVALRKEQKALTQTSKSLDAQIEAITDNLSITSSAFQNSSSSIDDTTKSIVEAEDAVRDMIRAYDDETSKLEMTNRERERFVFILKMEEEGIRRNTELGKEMIRVFGDVQSFRTAAEGRIKRLEQEKQALEEFQAEAERINNQIGQSLTDALMDGGRNAKELLQDLFRTLILRPILQPIISGTLGMLGVGSAGAAFAGVDGGGSSMGNALGMSNLVSTVMSVFDVATTGFAAVGDTVAFALQDAGAWLVNNTSGWMNSAGATMMESSAAMGTAATALTGIAAGITSGTLISGQYSVAGDQMVATGIGTAAGAIIGSVVPVIGTALGAFIGGTLGGIVNRAFGMGGKTTEAIGIGGFMSTTGANAEQFEITKRKGGWFKSDKINTNWSALDQETFNYFDQTARAISNTVIGMADSLGISAERLDGFSRTFMLDFKGLSEEQIQAKIQEEFGYFADALAETINPAIWNFKRGSETASQILSRLSTNLTTVNRTFDVLGFNLYETSLEGANAAQSLVDVFGGLERFSATTSYYYENFYTAQEKVDKQLEQTTELFNALGLKLPDTKAAFRAMVESAQAAGDSALLSSLLQIAPAFVNLQTSLEQIGEATEDTTQTLQDLQRIEKERVSLENQLYTLLGDNNVLREREIESIDKSNRGLQEHIYAIEDAQKAQLAADQAVADARADLQAAVSAEIADIEKRINDDLAKTLDGLAATFDDLTESINGQISALQTQKQVAQELVQELGSMFDFLQRSIANLFGGSTMTAESGLAFIDDAISAAKNTGYLPELVDLQNAVTAAQGGLSSGNFSSEFEQQIATTTLANKLSELQTLVAEAESDAKDQVDSADEQIELLRRRLEQAKQQYDHQVEKTRSYYDAQLEKEREQLNALLGINSGVISVSSAVQALATALDNQAAATDALQDAKDAADKALEDAAKEPDQTARQRAIAALYEEYLGRSAATHEIAYWDNNGHSLGEINDWIKNSQEAIRYGIEQAYLEILNRSADAGGLAYWTAKVLNGELTLAGVEAELEKSIPAYASGGQASTGLALVGEEGPELVNFSKPAMVYSAGQTAAMFNGNGDSDNVATEVRYLRDETKAQGKAMVSMQYRLTKLLERWDVDGLPEERDFA